jgi:hypothetical protein
MWAVFIWLRIRTVAGPCKNLDEPSAFHRMLGTIRHAEQLLASQERPSKGEN